MYCPNCKAEFREGFSQCMKCGVDLVEALADTPPIGEDRLAGGPRTPRGFDVARWLKTGAVVYVAVQALNAFLGRLSTANLGAGVGGVGLYLLTAAGLLLSALMQGLVYYGLGEIINLLRHGPKHGVE